MTYLLDDILCMVCTQLRHQRDSNTLFNCACSGKQLAVIAVMNLYRMQQIRVSSNFINVDIDEEIPAHHRLVTVGACDTTTFDLICRQPASFWRAIILSSLSKTLYPYSQYIRTLNLEDLEEMLNDLKLRVRTRRYFFQGELAQFKIKSHGQLNTEEIIKRITETITKQIPLVEELTGKVLGGEFSRWIPRLPRLTHLNTWQSAVIKENGTLIRLHCPLFKGLSLSLWNENDSNPSCRSLAAFLNELRPHSIESFNPFIIQLGSEILQALSCHGESLTELKLDMFSVTTIDDPTSFNLSLLKGCTNLVSLSLTMYGEVAAPDSGKISRCFFTNLDVSRRDAFLETLTWLKECKKLQTLTLFGCFVPAWIAPILFEDSIRLTTFEYQSFETEMCDIQKLHQALACQTSLQKLWLKGNVNEYPVEADVLVGSLSKLVNLMDLRLESMSESFVDRHIVQLAGSLPKLQCWLTRGCRLTDAIWGEVASLRSLRRLEIRSSSSFTVDGILHFIEKLGPCNKGLVLCVVNEGTNSEEDSDEGDKEAFTQPEIALMQEKIAEKVKGRFIHLSPTRAQIAPGGPWIEV